MPLFDENDYDNALDADGIPEGMVDVSYNLTVERKLIDCLSASIDEPILSPWMFCSLDELPTVLGVEPPVDDDDDLCTALLLGGVAVATTLMDAIHEDYVPGLLSHLASLHDQIDAEQGDEDSVIEPRYLLAQLVESCEPSDPTAARLAMMRILDSAFDENGEVLPEKALATCKYLMCIALAVLCGDADDCTVDLIEILKESHAERAAEPIIPYFDDVDGVED
jgi:hypothetical protein